MLLVGLERPSSRARYIVRHVLERMLGWPVTFAGSLEEFRSAGGLKLYYGWSAIDGAFHVRPSGWSDAVGVPHGNPDHRGSGEDLVLFPDGDGFDVFAASFFLLALVEEYAVRDRDAHGRLPADSLLIVRNGAERVPLVDRWVLRLSRDLRDRFPGLPEPERRYRHVLTVDVDNGLVYAGRPCTRALGASVKDLFRKGPHAVWERWRVRGGSDRDPYAVLPERLAEVRNNVDRMMAFFLVRGNGRFDHAADMDHPAYRELLAAVAQHAEAALHPSYGSSRDPALMQEELHRLQTTMGRPARASRQHFLRWELPGTLHTLNKLGFTEEHSLGFSDRTGFRAGTCTPFPWYDLERDEETPLMLWPFAAMDSALRERMNRSPEQALDELRAMADAAREVGGTFVSVWHDRYLSGHGEFDPWPEVMRQLVQHARA